MASRNRFCTRRSYLASVGGAMLGAGCGGSGSSDDATATPGNGSTRQTRMQTESGTGPPAFDPTEPLAERYEMQRERTVFRETPDGPLHVEAALPDGEGPFPVMFHVHGGAWRYGSPGFGGMETIARAGVAALSVGYRLSGTVTYPQPVRDVVAGIHWTIANEPDWNVDPDRLALVGGSAGAHLVALVAGAPDHPNFQPEDFEVDGDGNVDVYRSVDAVVPHYGIFDLMGRDACSDRNLGQFLGEDCGDESVVREVSPVTHIDGSHPDVLCFHGAADELVPPGQSRRYRDALQDAGVPVEYHELEGANHGYLDPNNEDMADDRRKANRRTMRYLFEGTWSGDTTGSD